MKDTKKHETLTMRISPGVKKALVDLAKQERRSITNMIECLVIEHCSMRGIKVRDDNV